MKRSLCINPLFALVSSVNRLYISSEEVPDFMLSPCSVCCMLSFG